MPIQKPSLAEGEIYVATIISADGKFNHHIVLLPGSTHATFKEAMDWAKSIGGDLPNRVEQALLFATLKDEFEEATYWSNASESGWAWYQNFYYGYQNNYRKCSELSARAVRRLPIQ